MLQIGVLKNFDSGTYKAGVQLAGSLTTYFDDISVAKNIPSSALVIGNYVIVAIPGGNPRDACVIATWPQGSAGGGMEVHGNEYHDPNFEEEGVAASLVELHRTTELHTLNQPTHLDLIAGVGSCRYELSADQTIPNDGGWHTIEFDTKIWDTLDEFDIVNHRYLPSQPGLYLAILSECYISFPADCTVQARIMLNGVVVGHTGIFHHHGSSWFRNNVAIIVQMIVGDYLYTQTSQRKTGSAQNLSKHGSTHFIAHRLK